MSRILIVDDEESILKALKRVLSLTPCTVGEKTYKLSVDVFSSPVTALEKASGTAYDLVLSDYRMPDMDGVQFLKFVRALQPNAVRMILSGYADLNGLISAINEVGISRFMSKPWNDYELVSAIGQALALRDLSLENQRLADQARVANGTLTAHDLELKRLEAEEPGITHVVWDADGSVVIDESMRDVRERS
jgi:DNA-binding NtrC family response regulator